MRLNHRGTENTEILGSAGGNYLIANSIGTDATATTKIGGGDGVDIQNDAGDTQVLNNVISGNNNYGVQIADSSGTTVAGNFIGTDVSGSPTVANGVAGIEIRSSSGSSAANVIGGATAATRNVISGNVDDGVILNGSGTTGNTLEGNDIGTAADGTSNLGNGNRGVFVFNGAHDNAIGARPLLGNVIAFNHDDGVLIGRDSGAPVSLEAGTGNAVLDNTIFSNGKLGIELGPDTGVPAVNNSAGLVINSPTLSPAASDLIFPDTINVTGNWQSNSFTPGNYLVELFENAMADPSGHGQGKNFVTLDYVVINNNSNNFTLSFLDPNPAGQIFSCTITDPFGNTSEFSNDVTVS